MGTSNTYNCVEIREITSTWLKNPQAASNEYHQDVFVQK